MLIFVEIKGVDKKVPLLLYHVYIYKVIIYQGSLICDEHFQVRTTFKNVNQKLSNSKKF